MDWLRHRRTLGRWKKIRQNIGAFSFDDLRKARSRARGLRNHLNDVIAEADYRLALPAIGTNTFPKPNGTDWSWRPMLWREPLERPGMASADSNTPLGEEITLFHDCKYSELNLRQVRSQRESDLAPFGLGMDVFNFDGSFLSLVLDLPPEATDGLTRKHLIRIDTIVEMEKPLEIFARLNIKHGPNSEQVVRELPLHEDSVMVEFDLAYTNLNEKRVERGWIDLIFENPEMSQVTLRDFTMTRRPRAEF